MDDKDEKSKLYGAPPLVACDLLFPFVPSTPEVVVPLRVVVVPLLVHVVPLLAVVVPLVAVPGNSCTKVSANNARK